MNKQKKIIVILLLSLVLVWTAIFMVKCNTKKPPSLAVIEYTHRDCRLEKVECNLNKTEIKLILDAFYDVKYDYEEKDYLGHKYESAVLGTASIKPNKIVVMNNLTNETYCVVLAHELTHIKYKTSDETFTEYKSIVLLYETKIPMFQKSALNRARRIVSGHFKGTEYDCGYYLLNYFGGIL